MTNYKVVHKIARKGYPTISREYVVAHAEADNAEKKKYPLGYKKLKVIDDKLSSNQLVGKNSKSGKITVSSKVPKNYVMK